MSGHRITAIIAFALCTSGAFANDGIDLSLYSEPWPVNYFVYIEGSDLSFGNSPVAAKIPKCDWNGNKVIPHRFAQHIAGVEEENYEGLAPMWLRGETGYGGQFQVMKCAGTVPEYEDEPALFDAINESIERDDSFTPDWVKGGTVSFPACGQTGVVYTAEPQRHLGDTTGYAYWRCGEDGKWAKADYAMQCGQYPIDTSNETRKYLLQTDVGWGVVCGPHPDDKEKMTVSNLLGIDQTPRTPRWVTVKGHACAPGVKIATTEQNYHLGDDVGGKIWRCVCDDKGCRWDPEKDIQTCTVDKLPLQGQSDQNPHRMFAKGPSNGKKILVNRESAGGKFARNAGPAGYTYLIDRDPDADFPSTMCVSAICRYDDTTPNRDNSACIEKNKKCLYGNTEHGVGSVVGGNYKEQPELCLSPNIGTSSIASGNDLLSYNHLKNDAPCSYYCTEHGWAVRLQQDSCADEYVTSFDKRSCISRTEVEQQFCENSGGTWENGKCKCGKKLRPVNDGEYCECRGAYDYADNLKPDPELWCVSDGVGSCQGSSNNNCFDINELSNEWERALRQVSQGAVSDNFVSNATDDAANNDAESISALAKTLDDIEDAYGLSKWRTVDGKFNYARLASDATAAVVLGTTGALVTSSVVKKKQVEAGFESLECTVGGQHVGDWGDVFRIDGK